MCIVLLCGLPGAGKSTFAQSIAREVETGGAECLQRLIGCAGKPRAVLVTQPFCGLSERICLRALALSLIESNPVKSKIISWTLFDILLWSTVSA